MRINRLFRKIKRLLSKTKKLLRKFWRLRSIFWRLLRVRESERGLKFQLMQIREAQQPTGVGDVGDGDVVTLRPQMS